MFNVTMNFSNQKMEQESLYDVNNAYDISSSNNYTTLTTVARSTMVDPYSGMLTPKMEPQYSMESEDSYYDYNGFYYNTGALSPPWDHNGVNYFYNWTYTHQDLSASDRMLRCGNYGSYSDGYQAQDGSRAGLENDIKVTSAQVDGRELPGSKNCQFAPATFDQLESLTSDDIKKLIDDDIMLKESGIYNYDYDPEDLKDFDVPDPGYESTSSSNLSYPQVPTTVFQVGTDELSVSATLTHQLPGYRTDVTSGAYAAAAQQKEKAPLSRPRMRAASDCSSDGEVRAPPKKRGRRQGQLSKGNHLWEFIRDLLLDPVTNPSVIRWEDEENGVFRIVNSKRVSELWGNKKSNPGMNYEKLSRAMRHYYKSEILEAVLGRRLVYRFGKNSSGWQRTKTESR